MKYIANLKNIRRKKGKFTIKKTVNTLNQNKQWYCETRLKLKIIIVITES